jgi:hypothetical protein
LAAAVLVALPRPRLVVTAVILFLRLLHPRAAAVAGREVYLPHLPHPTLVVRVAVEPELAPVVALDNQEQPELPDKETLVEMGTIT